MGVFPAVQSQTKLVLPAHIARLDPQKVTTSHGGLGTGVPGFELRFFFLTHWREGREEGNRWPLRLGNNEA